MKRLNVARILRRDLSLSSLPVALRLVDDLADTIQNQRPHDRPPDVVAKSLLQISQQVLHIERQAMFMPLALHAVMGRRDLKLFGDEGRVAEVLPCGSERLEALRDTVAQRHELHGMKRATASCLVRSIFFF